MEDIMRTVRIQHEVVIYEETTDGLCKREVARFSFFTTEYLETPPEERCKIIVEVQ